jgi:hypothetical protein
MEMRRVVWFVRRDVPHEEMEIVLYEGLLVSLGQLI